MGDLLISSPPPLPHFVGREKELIWLEHEANGRERFRHSFSPIVIAGLGGIGKTSLVREFVRHRDRHLTTKWFNAHEFNPGATGKALAAFTDAVYAERRSTEMWIVLDGLDEGEFEHDQIVGA